MKRMNLKGMYISTSSGTAVAIPAHDGHIYLACKAASG